MSEPTRSIAEFHRLLTRAIEGVDAGGSVHLARLGKRLKALDDSFAPAAFGHAKLADLLATVPELGVLRWRSETSAVFEVRSRTRLLHSWVWKTATDFAPPDGGWWLDLLTCSRLCDAEDEDRLLRTTPERFVPFAVAGSSFQRELARAFVAERAPEMATAIEATLGTDGWLRAIEEMLASTDLLDEWRQRRKDAVVAHVLDWGRGHGIDEKLLAYTTQDKPVPTPPAPSPSGPPGELRDLLHAALDCLDEDALGDVLLPARAWAELIRREDR